MKTLLLLLLFLNSCTISKKSTDFTNKYLVYTQRFKRDDSEFYKGFFIVNIEDTNFRIREPFGYRYAFNKFKNDGAGTIHYETVSSDVPYTIKKKQRGIYYTYYEHGKQFEVKKYSLKPGDTCRINIDDSKILGATDNMYYSVNLGIDTMINSLGYNFHCVKFIEEVMAWNGETYYEKYFDKKSFLPIMINKIVYSYNDTFKSYKKTEYKLRFLLELNEVQSHEWDYCNLYLERE